MLAIFYKLKIHFQQSTFTSGQIRVWFAKMMCNKRANTMAQSDWTGNERVPGPKQNWYGKHVWSPWWLKCQTYLVPRLYHKTMFIYQTSLSYWNATWIFVGTNLFLSEELMISYLSVRWPNLRISRLTCAQTSVWNFLIEFWIEGPFLPHIRKNRSRIQMYYVTYL